jgi:hypothetical protein
MRFAVTLFLVLALGAAAGAQEAPRRSYYDDHRVWGLGAQISVPYSDFDANYDTGYGVHALMDYPLAPLFSLTGDVGWNRFSGVSEREDLDLWEVAVGGKFNLPPFFIGGDVAYYSEVDNVNWVPSLGLRFERWEIALRWKAAERTGWVSYRLGFYF